MEGAFVVLFYWKYYLLAPLREGKSEIEYLRVCGKDRKGGIYIFSKFTLTPT